MAATAGSVAVGSTIGHGISSMLFGGGGQAASAQETPAPAPPVQHQQASGISCEAQAKGELIILVYVFQLTSIWTLQNSLSVLARPIILRAHGTLSSLRL